MSNEAIFDIKQIREVILHRYPFLLIDRVIKFEDHKEIVAIKNVTINEPYFQGHFPNLPVMPGVLIMEALAQAACVLACKSTNAISPSKAVYLVGADGFKWKKMVTPGDTLTLKVVFTRNRGPFWYFDCEATVDGSIAAKGSLVAATDS